jgi:hypothetical protein
VPLRAGRSHPQNLKPQTEELRKPQTEKLRTLQTKELREPGTEDFRKPQTEESGEVAPPDSHRRELVSILSWSLCQPRSAVVECKKAEIATASAREPKWTSNP